jgi:hypothetical protein
VFNNEICHTSSCYQGVPAHAIKGAQENKDRLQMNGTHQLLVNADYVNLLDENVNITKKKQKLY